MNRITHLGIDIGGAHLKVIGVNKSNKVVFVDYNYCKIWEGIEKLQAKFKNINKIINNNSVKCGITMSGEMCDNFKNRLQGAKTLIKECNKLEFNNFFYVSSKKIFTKKPNIEKLISLNWHSIGKFLENKIESCIAIDFGSTTTDFICIKNNKMVNKFTDDYSRINNSELLYTGFTRTPIFGVVHQIDYNKKKLNIIPEFFSNTSDIYRVLGKLDKEIDLEETADKSRKDLQRSLIRLSRSFGFDYKSKNLKKIKVISQKISTIQLNQISKIILQLQKKFLLKDEPVVISGIGQDVVYNFLKKKKFKTIYFKEFLNKSRLNKEASFHAPAVSIALLLQSLK
tara:strand:+ start:1840 stop:2862 length:1023 start_codon:yes stop_codon:yes gene_type:complete